MGALWAYCKDRGASWKVAHRSLVLTELPGQPGLAPAYRAALGSWVDCLCCPLDMSGEGWACAAASCKEVTFAWGGSDQEQPADLCRPVKSRDNLAQVDSWVHFRTCLRCSPERLTLRLGPWRPSTSPPAPQFSASPPTSSLSVSM